MSNRIDDDLMAFALEKAMAMDNEYVDIKWMERSTRSLNAKNGNLEQNIQRRSQGIGIKFLVQGGYGFSCTNKLTKDSIETTIKRAHRIANASARTMKRPIKLAPEPIHEDTVITPMKKDPLSIDLSDTIALLVDATKAADNGDSRIMARSANFDSWADHMVLWTSEGTRIDQTTVVTGGGVNSLVRQGSDVQRRSKPATFRGNFATAGFEYFEDMNLMEKAPEATEEALGLLEAPQCPVRNDATVIIQPAQLMLQLHENLHGAEMDRAFDWEAAFAGTSFLKPHLVNKLMFGNELITIYADATHPKGLGTFFYDHEGVQAQRTPLVKEGLFVGYMSSRDTAPLMGLERSSGAARALGFARMPLIRMTNTNLQPGDWKYEEMIEDTKDGYIFDTNVSWSIDDLRLSFQFGCEYGARVENGEITGLVKNPSYFGITPKFWNSANAVGNKDHFQMYGTPNCGKGEPGQIMYTGHGSPPVRFENVNIGVVKE